MATISLGRPSIKSTIAKPNAKAVMGQMETYGPLPYKSPSSIPIVAPKRTTIGQSYNDIKSTGLVPQYSPVSYTPVSGIDTSGFGKIQGFDDSYYQNLTNAASKRLQNQYFGADNSLTNQFKNTMNKRGLIGSGIEAGGLTDIYKDFGSQMADFQSELATTKAQQDLDLAKSNREFDYNALIANKDLERFNAEQGLNSQFKNKDLQNTLAQLGLSAAGDESRTATEFDTKMFDSAIKQKNAEQDYIAKILGELNTSLGNKLIDADTRQILENYFGTQIGNVLGRPYIPALPSKPISNQSNTYSTPSRNK